MNNKKMKQKYNVHISIFHLHIIINKKHL